MALVSDKFKNQTIQQGKQSWWDKTRNTAGNAVASVGNFLGLPEWGISERIGSDIGPTAPQRYEWMKQDPYGPQPKPTYTDESPISTDSINFGSTTTSGGGTTGTTQAEIDSKRVEIQKRLESARRTQVFIQQPNGRRKTGTVFFCRDPTALLTNFMKQIDHGLCFCL